MSSRDYRIMAEEISHTREDSTPDQVRALRALATRLCLSLVEENPRFNAEIFMAACGF